MTQGSFEKRLDWFRRYAVPDETNTADHKREFVAFSDFMANGCVPDSAARLAPHVMHLVCFPTLQETKGDDRWYEYCGHEYIEHPRCPPRFLRNRSWKSYCYPVEAGDRLVAEDVFYEVSIYTKSRFKFAGWISSDEP